MKHRNLLSRSFGSLKGSSSYIHACEITIIQMLSARIGNHVEIGANTCIDRGRWDMYYL